MCSLVLAYIVTGKDPLVEKLEGKDINSVAGVLKLYFRELKDPLFPFHMFDDLMACSSNCNFNSQFSPSSLAETRSLKSINSLFNHLLAH